MRFGLNVGCTVAVALALAVLSAGCVATTGGGAPGAVTRMDPAAANGAVEERVTVPTADLGLDAAGPAAPITVDAEDAAENARAKVASEHYFQTYTIGSGDLLAFRLFDDETLNTTVQVRHDGCISLPWVPDMKVAGLTREEATRLLTEAYNELYVDTEASLVITESRSKFYTVMGDVSRPAEYPYVRPLSLLDSINSAGGLRVNQRGGDSFMGAQGQLVKALVIRHEEGERKVLEFDLRNFQEPGAHVADTAVLPGDIVYVPEGINLVYLLGEVGRSQVMAISPDMTLLQLLANAGGFSEQASRMRDVVLIREQEGGQTEVFKVNVRRMLKDGTRFPLQPGDIVYVPQKRLVRLSSFLQQLYSPATQTMSLASQVMGLYQQVWNTWYTDERFELLYEQDNVQTLNTLELLRSLQDLSDLNTLFPTE